MQFTQPVYQADSGLPKPAKRDALAGRIVAVSACAEQAETVQMSFTQIGAFAMETRKKCHSRAGGNPEC